MARRKLTLVVDEELLQQARGFRREEAHYRQRLGRKFLARLGSEEQRLSAWESIRDLVENPRAMIGGGLPSRDELHLRERRSRSPARL
jgi:hypothetical protein